MFVRHFPDSAMFGHFCTILSISFTILFTPGLCLIIQFSFVDQTLDLYESLRRKSIWFWKTLGSQTCMLFIHCIELVSLKSSTENILPRTFLESPTSAPVRVLVDVNINHRQSQFARICYTNTVPVVPEAPDWLNYWTILSHQDSGEITSKTSVSNKMLISSPNNGSDFLRSIAFSFLL